MEELLYKLECYKPYRFFNENSEIRFMKGILQEKIKDIVFFVLHSDIIVNGTRMKTPENMIIIEKFKSFFIKNDLEKDFHFFLEQIVLEEL